MTTYLVPDAAHQPETQLRELTTGGELVSNSNPLPVSASVTPPASAVSTANSSTTLLAGGATFTGTGESILAYGSISVSVFADQASAANGLKIEQSQDNTNWDLITQASVSASTAYQTTVNASSQYFRVLYTNGATPQGTFRLQTIKEVAASPSAGVANQRVNAQSGDFAAGSIVDLATVAGAVSGGKMLTTETNSAASKTDLDSIVTNTSGTKTDLDNLNTVTGLTSDAAVTGDNAGTLSAKLRGLTKMLFDMWDSTNHWLQVKVMNGNANGQTTKVNSSPVVIASDQWSYSSPNIMEPNIQNAVRTGNAYFANTGALTGSAAYAAISIFNPNASGVNMLVFGLNIIASSASNFCYIRLTTADPALGTAASVANHNLGNLNPGSGNASAASVTYAAASVALPALSASSVGYGSYENFTGGSGSLMANGLIAPVYLPPNHGLTCYMNISAGTINFGLYWIESASI